MSKASPISEVPSQYILPYHLEPPVHQSALETLAIRVMDVFSRLGDWMHSFKEYMISQLGLKKEVQIPTPSELMSVEATALIPPFQLIWQPETRCARLGFMSPPIICHAKIAGGMSGEIQIASAAPLQHAAVKAPAIENLPDTKKMEIAASKLAEKATFFKKAGPRSATVVPASKAQAARLQPRQLSQKQIKEAKQLAKAKSIGVKFEKFLKAYLRIK